MFYRIKQFITGITATIGDDDILFISTYLNKKEKKLFVSLPKYIQSHSIRVARSVQKEMLKQNTYDKLLVKAAVLHDVGKVNGGLNIFVKSIIVILDKVFPTTLKKLSRFNSIYTYYNHPEIALSYLDDENEYVKYLIKNHHNYSLSGDRKLSMLQRADSKN